MKKLNLKEAVIIYIDLRNYPKGNGKNAMILLMFMYVNFVNFQRNLNHGKSYAKCYQFIATFDFVDGLNNKIYRSWYPINIKYMVTVLKYMN